MVGGRRPSPLRHLAAQRLPLAGPRCGGPSRTAAGLDAWRGRGPRVAWAAARAADAQDSGGGADPSADGGAGAGVAAAAPCPHHAPRPPLPAPLPPLARVPLDARPPRLPPPRALGLLSRSLPRLTS
eukprot:409184-Rhodomonas_salina.4